MVDPAVGDLRSSSVSEDTVLHALHTWVFPHIPKGWFVFFDLCTCNEEKKKKKKKGVCGGGLLSLQTD